MNTSATPEMPAMGDDDIRAFSQPATQPAMRPATPPPPPRRRRWPWVLLVLALLGLVMLVSIGSLAWDSMHAAHGLGSLRNLDDWQVEIGPEVWHGDGSLGAALLALLWGGLALLIVAVVLPLTLLGAGLAVGLALTLGVLALVATLGLALGAAVLVLLLLSSPLWLLGLLLWWALKPAAVASASSV
jgi:MYXO-CTERM domain-containing protein